MSQHEEAKADGQFSHRGGYDQSTRTLLEFLRRNPHATLASGQGGLLAKEITRLEQKLATFGRLVTTAVDLITGGPEDAHRRLSMEPGHGLGSLKLRLDQTQGRGIRSTSVMISATELEHVYSVAELLIVKLEHLGGKMESQTEERLPFGHVPPPHPSVKESPDASAS